MRKLQTFGEYEEGYYRKHPEEIDSYLKPFLKNGPRMAIPGHCWHHYEPSAG